MFTGKTHIEIALNFEKLKLVLTGRRYTMTALNLARGVYRQKQIPKLRYIEITVHFEKRNLVRIIICGYRKVRTGVNR